MANVVQDSHWISRSLLRRWERAPGKLRCFDFSTGRVSRGSAKGTFVSPTPFPADVEADLGAIVETPLGDYLARCRTAGKGLVVTPNEREDHAIILALMCQSMRTKHAQGDEALHDIASLLRDGVERRRAFVTGARHSFEFLGANLVRDRLFFPESGSVSLPVAGCHGWMLPLSPTAFIACLPKYVFQAEPRSSAEADFPVVEGSRDAALNALLSTPGVLTTISVGIVGDRVVLPPEMTGSDEEIAAELKERRKHAKELNALVYRANTVAARIARRGFPGDGRSSA